MTWSPHVTVAAVVERQGRFLLVEELAGGERVYNQPAGHLEPGESLVAAAVRETLEETAAGFTPQALIAVYRWVHPEKDITFLRFTFAGTCGEADPLRELDEGILGTVWLTRDELAARSDRLRSPLVLQSIDDFLSGRRYPLELLGDIR